MSLEKILTNASTGLSAESIRMNTIASNLANSGNFGSSEEATYHSKYPLFSEITQNIPGINSADQPTGGVKVDQIVKSEKALERRYEPSHPLANSEGYIYLTDVNPIEQMTNMIAASKEYQANVEVMNTAKNLISQTISIMTEK
jgi:flagellar basal-body rod protein FlgC